MLTRERILEILSTGEMTEAERAELAKLNTRAVVEAESALEKSKTEEKDSDTDPEQ